MSDWTRDYHVTQDVSPTPKEQSAQQTHHPFEEAVTEERIVAPPETLRFSVGTSLKTVERRLIESTLLHTGGDKELAACLLGITSRTIYRREAEWRALPDLSPDIRNHVATPEERSLVDHPAHYNQGQYEVIDVIEDWNLGFHAGNVIKYVSRYPHKGTPLRDLKKAQWYLERLIEMEEQNASE